MADEVGVGFFIRADLIQESAGAGAGDGAEVLDQVVVGHADAVVGDGDGLRRDGDVDLQLVAFGEEFGVGEGQVAELVAGVGGVGDELAQEDLPVRVQGMGDDIEEAGDLGLEGVVFGAHKTPAFARFLALARGWETICDRKSPGARPYMTLAAPWVFYVDLQPEERQSDWAISSWRAVFKQPETCQGAQPSFAGDRCAVVLDKFPAV